MKTEFSTEIPQFDKILAENGEDKEIIEEYLRVAGELSVEEFSEKIKELTSVSIDIESVNTSKDDIEIVETTKNAAKDIANNCFGIKVKDKLPTERFHFLDGNISYGSFKIKSFYSAFNGLVFISKQENDVLSLIETFRQVWNIISYSWISYAKESFPCQIGLLCSFSDKNYFSKLNSAFNSHAAFIFYNNYKDRVPLFREQKNSLINHIFSKEDYELFGSTISQIVRSNDIDSGRLGQSFHRAKLTGDFFDIRTYCRNTYGPKGLKFLGDITT
jgi:hypothetical protein